jgi:hypothetical protein
MGGCNKRNGTSVGLAESNDLFANQKLSWSVCVHGSQINSPFLGIALCERDVLQSRHKIYDIALLIITIPLRPLKKNRFLINYLSWFGLIHCLLKISVNEKCCGRKMPSYLIKPKTMAGQSRQSKTFVRASHSHGSGMVRIYFDKAEDEAPT